MEQHLAMFLEFADKVATDVYKVEDSLAAELEQASGCLLRKPGLNGEAAEGRHVCHRLVSLAQAVYLPDRSEHAPAGAASLRRASLNMDVLARRIRFGLALKGLRVRQGIEQKELAVKAGINPGYESRLERFLAGPPSPDVAQRLSAALEDAGYELMESYQAVPSWQTSATPRLKLAAENDELLGQLMTVCSKLSPEHLRIILAQAQAVHDLTRSQERDPTHR